MCVHYIIEQTDSVLQHAKSVADVFDIHGETMPSIAWPRSKMPVIMGNAGARALTLMR